VTRCFAPSASAFGLVNENLAIWTRLGVGLEKSDRGNGVGVANV
jgi:hypothetical protein